MNDPQFNQQQYGSTGTDPLAGASPVQPTPPVTPVTPSGPTMADVSGAGTPSGWAPPTTPGTTPDTAGSAAASPTTGSIDPIGQPLGQTQEMYPVNQPESGGSKTIILIVILAILVIAGGLVLAAWQGWVKIPFLNNLFAGTGQTTDQPAETPVPVVNTNDAKRKTDLSNIKVALKAYYQAKQTYPVAAVSQKTSDLNNALTALVPDYITTLPVDPLSPVNYYSYVSDGKTFTLTCALEDRTDSSGRAAGNYYIYTVTDTSVETPTSGSSSTGTTSSGQTGGTSSAPTSTSTTTTTDTTTTGTSTSTDTSTGTSGGSASASADATAGTSQGIAE